MGKPVVTMEAIAKAANVSVGTVDRALNNRGRINKETKQRIIQIASEFGYRANSIASALGRQRNIHLAIIMPQEPYYFCNEMISGVKAALTELEDFGVKADFFLTHSQNPYEQEKLLQTFDAEHYSGIAIDAGGDLLRKYLDSYVESGIPVVTFNTDLRSSKRLLYIGDDAFKTGCLAAEFIGRILMREQKICKIAVLVGFDDVYSQIQRRDGFLSVIESEYVNIKVVAQMKCEDSAEKAQQATKEILEQYPDIDGFFLTFGVGTVGVGNQIIKAGITKHPIIVGYDLSKNAAELLKNGVCTALIYQDPYRQGYYGVKLLAKHLLEKWQPEDQYFYIRSKLVLKHNLSDYFIEGRTPWKILD
jgi:LacI family transcriptional regulator